MANGTAALQLLTPEPSSAPPSPTEVVIGEEAAAVVAIAVAMDDCAAGGARTPATRSWSGAMLGRVAKLHLAHLGDPQDNFSAIVHREGKRALHARPDGVLLARLVCSRPGPDLDNLIRKTSS